MSPGKETPQLLWAACSRVLSPSQQRNSSSYLDGTSFVSVVAVVLCPVSGHQREESGPILLASTHKILVYI